MTSTTPDYTRTASTITHLSGRNMDYELERGEPWVHSSYVRRVRLLSGSIRLATSQP